LFKVIAALATSFLVLTAQVPKEAAEAVIRFQKAVASGDVQLLSEIAHFPIRSNEFPTIRNPKELKTLFPKIFPPDRKSGLQGQIPSAGIKGFVFVFAKDEDDPIRFVFQRYGKVYLWRSIDNINE